MKDINAVIRSLSNHSPDYPTLRATLSQWQPPCWFSQGSRGILTEAGASSITEPFSHLIDPIKNPLLEEMLNAFCRVGGEDVTRAINTAWPMFLRTSEALQIAAVRAYWCIGGYHAVLGLTRIAEESTISWRSRKEALAAVCDLAERGDSCADEGGQLPCPESAKQAWKENPDIFPDEWKDLMDRFLALEKSVTRNTPEERLFSSIAYDTFRVTLTRCHEKITGIYRPQHRP